MILYLENECWYQKWIKNCHDHVIKTDWKRRQSLCHFPKSDTKDDQLTIESKGGGVCYFIPERYFYSHSDFLHEKLVI